MGRIGDRWAAHGIGGGPADDHVASGGEVGGQAYRRGLSARRPPLSRLVPLSLHACGDG